MDKNKKLEKEKSLQSTNIKSSYSRDDRKHIVECIETLKNDEDYVKIFEILTCDQKNSYTQNSNGVFLNLSKSSDETLDKITSYLRKVERRNKKKQEIEIDIDPVYENSGYEQRAYKLSNYEKNILKQRNLKKVLNGDDDYMELKIAPEKKSKKHSRCEY